MSGPSGMITRWPPRPLSLRARTGMALDCAKGGRVLRTQSRRCTQQRLFVEEGGGRLAVAPIMRSKGAFSLCNFAPATEKESDNAGWALAQSDAHAECRGTQGEALTGCERTIHTASLISPHMRVFIARGDREGGVFP